MPLVHEVGEAVNEHVVKDAHAAGDRDVGCAKDGVALDCEDVHNVAGAAAGC